MMQGNTQSRAAVIGTTGRRFAALVFIILSTFVVARAQSSTIPTVRPVNASAPQPDARITPLLIELADQARASDDPAFAVRAQAEAASLLWPRDPERARDIYRRAFALLLPNAAPKTSERNESARQSSRSQMTADDKQHLRAELLNQIVSRDPELADDLARTLADAVIAIKDNCANGSLTGNCNEARRAAALSSASLTAPITQSDIEQRELLISVALQVVEREPQRAMSLGQLSLASGISENFFRLLMLMRAVDPALADLLFSSALARLEQTPSAQLAEIHALGAYLVAVAHSPARQIVSKAEVAKFINFALYQISQRTNAIALPQALQPDQAALVYFLKRQLADLTAQYVPERRSDVIGRLRAIRDDGSHEPAFDVTATPTRADARDAADEIERDRLYARAALAALSRAAPIEAQSIATKIADVETRDRVLAQVAQHYIWDKHFEEAATVARCINDEAARIESLVTASNAALAAKDRQSASELLNEAAYYTARESAAARARALFKIAASFSAFDPQRGFEVAQSAVKAANEILTTAETRATDESSSAAKNKAQQPDDAFAADSERTLAQLARIDFIRALWLAQQFSRKETAVVAQLAVCRGGLESDSLKEQAQAVTETEAGANQ
jgi:hypothetical protein